MKIINLYLLIFLALLSISCTNQPNKLDEDTTSESIESANPVIPYQQDTILREAEIFFGSTAQGMADVLNQAFLDNGLPDAYIKGEEASGSIGIGVKFGHGDLFLSNGTTNKVFWRGHTLGFHIGGNATKVKKLGANFLIVGRTILNSKNPKKTAKQLALDSIL